MSFEFITSENIHKAFLAFEYFTNIWRIEATEGRPGDDDWQVLRKIVFKRDGRRCCNCMAKIRRLDVHHVVPLCSGGTNRLTNLKAVCFMCHQSIHPWITI